MTERRKEQITVVGIDLAKHSFHLYGANAAGRQVLSRKLTRKQLGALVARLPACTIAMEACGSAHYWARRFREHGHQAAKDASGTLREPSRQRLGRRVLPASRF